MSDEMLVMYDPAQDQEVALEVPTERSVYGEFMVLVFTGAFQSGYAMGYPGLNYTDAEGTHNVAIKGFKPGGKKADGSQTAVGYLVYRGQKKDGGQFCTFPKAVFLNGKEWRQIILPGLKAVFGEDLAKVPRGKWIAAKALEVPFGEPNDKGYQDKHYKLVEVYPTVAAMNEARDAFFAQFGNGTGGGSASNPYVALGLPVPEAWAGAESDYYASMPQIMGILNTALAAPNLTVPAFKAKWENDPAVKEVGATYLVDAVTAAALYTKRAEIGQIAPL